MAPIQKNIQHFTHPNHSLLQINIDNEYICDGCKIIGTGKRYNCKSCNFDLHEHCATCPATFSSFMHPQHPLTLVMRKPQGTRSIDRTCDVCRDHVEGLFYRCKICEFDVHPLCTQLPRQLCHALHLAHPLTFQLPPSAGGYCLVCKGACGSWRYRCAGCCVDIHLECIIVAPSPPGPPPYNQTSSTRSVQQPPSYQPPAPPYGGTYHNMHQHQYQYQYQDYNSYNPNYNNINEGQGSGGARRVGNFMYSLVGKLAVGVLSNAVFGLTGV